MARFNDHKLQLLMQQTTPGMVISSAWLKKHGISSKLAWWYVKSGWLERVAIGAFKRPGDNVTWMGAVSALQYQLNLPIHIGGKTALQLLGRGHYVPIAGIKKILLYRATRFTIPQWFRYTDWLVDLEIHTANFFADHGSSDAAILEREFDNVKLKLSAPERSIMEVLYHVPQYNTFNEASLLMENLAQLRPKVVQTLLQNCLSIKTKRLFLYFAEKFAHPWMKALNLDTVKLGSGKIKIGEGGKYIGKYKISIPETEENEYQL